MIRGIRSTTRFTFAALHADLGRYKVVQVSTFPLSWHAEATATARSFSTFPFFIMDNSLRPDVDPKLVKELIDAAEEAADAMSDSLNLDLGVGNADCEDVKNLGAALDRLSAALEGIEAAGN